MERIRRHFGEPVVCSSASDVEKRPSDMQLFFTIRSQEEARHAEVCHAMAEKLGGYIEKPVQQLFQGSVATHGVRRATLNADTFRSRASSRRSSAPRRRSPSTCSSISTT